MMRNHRNSPEGNPDQGVGSPNTFITPARHRILSFALAVCLLLGGIIWQSPMTMQVQAADNAGEMQAGTWVDNRRYIEFGSYNGSPILWRVLEVYTSDGTDGNTIGNKTAFLLADDLLRDGSGNLETRRFGNGYDWSSSEIRDWLNGESAGEFLHTDNFSPTERGAILLTSADKVFLLSETEVMNNRYFSDNEDRAADSEWWLRSSYLSNMRMVGITGSVYNYQPTIARGVRPALKVNLSSSIFISQNPQYGVEITVTDGGSPVPGACVSLSGASGSNTMFYTGGDGVGRCRASEGSYSVAVDKTGYAVKTESVTIGTGNTDHTVTLTVDDSLPGAVYFGQNSNVPLAWRVLDIDRDGGTALLLTESIVGSAVDWATVTSWIDNTGSGGFLDSTNFTDSERASMLVNSDTGTKAFLLSKDEAALYLPDWGSRSVGIFWWLRSSNGNEIVNGDGTFEVAVTCRPRPAVWLDLEQLYMTTAGGNTTLHALHSATITVTDGTNPIDGAEVRLANSSMPATKTAAGNAIALTGATAGGGTTFNLPAGTYTIDVTGPVGYSNQSGSITINADGTGDLTITLETLAGVSIDSLYLTVGETADFTVNPGEGANAATSASISSSDTTIATATPTDLTLSLGQSGTVTVEGKSVGNTTISIGYSGGNWNGHTDKVQVTVTDAAQVRVDFDPQGGTPPPNPIDVVVGGNYPALPTVTRGSDTFEGWYTAASGGSEVTQGDTVTNNSDHTLYAQWSGGGSTRSSGGSSGGSSTPDSRTAKTQLPASAFAWDGGRTLTINHDSITPLGLLSVQWDGQPLNRGTDYGVYQGSVIVRFDQDFMAGQSPGDHTVRVEFLNHTGETTVTVGGEPAQTADDDQFAGDTYNPNTGGYPDNPQTGDNGSMGLWFTLLLGSLGGMALVISRWRKSWQTNA